MKRFFHGGDIEGYERKYGGKPIDFSANINPLGMPAGVRDAYLKALDGCLNYPDPTCGRLKKAIASFEGVAENNIICGNGADDLIFRAAYALKPENVLLLAPSFTEYEKAFRAAGSSINFHTLSKSNGFNLDESILSSIAGNGVFIMANPNNPTGTLAKKEIIIKIAEKCACENCVFIIDECFIDFIDGAFSAKNLLKLYDNIIVLKAFTKIFAMPGLRLGYGIIGRENFLERIDMAGQHWCVNYPAMVCGEAALNDLDYLSGAKAVINIEREYLKDALSLLGFKVYGSEANYIFFDGNKTDLEKEMEEEGFMIRSCGDYAGLGSNYYRIAVKLRPDNEALVEAFRRRLKNG